MGLAAAPAALSNARPEARPNCQMWARNRADLLPCPAWAFGRLPRHALAVLERLSRHEQRWAWVDYPRLGRHLGLTIRQVARSVLALRQTGLVEFVVRSRRVQLVAEADERYGRQAWARPLASCMKRADGTFALYVPEGFLTMAEKRGTRGGRRPGAGRKAKSNRQEPSEAVNTKCAESVDGAQPAGKSNRSILQSTDLDLLDPITFPEGKRRSAEPPGGVGFSETDKALDFDLSLPAVSRRRQPIPTDQRGPRPSVPAFDRPAVRYEGLRSRVPEPTAAQRAQMGEDAVREARVSAVVFGFDAALRKVYGGRGFYCRDITRSKVYPQLVAAADVLCEHDIPPGEWAEWRLGEAKKRGEKPWALGRVMQATVIHKLRGFFRRTAKADPTPRQDWKPYHLEQRLRAREADLRWKWGDDPPMLNFPREYTAMRERERQMGDAYADPLFNWPSPNNKPGRAK